MRPTLWHVGATAAVSNCPPTQPSTPQAACVDATLTMQVLNIAGNKISGKLRVQGVPKLRALIANDNAITAIKGAQAMRPQHAVV